MTRRVRIAVIVAAVVAGLLLVAVLIVRSLLSPQRFTRILQQAVSDVGLVMELHGDAEPELFPRPAIELHELRLHLPGESNLLTAEQVRLVVPWRSLFGGAPAITRLELTVPQLDLAQLRAWMEQLPATPRDGPPELPDIGVGVQVRGGRLLSADQLLLARIAIDAGSLHMGQRFALEAQAKTPEGQPLQLHLSVLPLQGENRVRLNDLELQLGSGDSTRLVLGGVLTWFGGDRLRGELAGRLKHANTSYAISLGSTAQPATDALMLDVRVHSDSTHIALRLSPQEVVAWWQGIRDPDSTRLALPPVLGTAASQEIELGSLHIEGLRIENTLPASPTGIAPEPASSTKLPASAHGTGTTPAGAASIAKKPV